MGVPFSLKSLYSQINQSSKLDTRIERLVDLAHKTLKNLLVMENSKWNCCKEYIFFIGFIGNEYSSNRCIRD